jgi:hypothetical protein
MRLMRRLVWLALAVVGAFSVSGCQLFNRGGDVAVDSQPAEEATPEGGTELPVVPDEEFSEPVVPGVPTSATVVAPDLIQSTNPNERAIGVARSRPDPFASLPIPPKPPEPIVAQKPEGAATPTTQANGGATTTQAAGNTGGASTPGPGTSGGAIGPNGASTVVVRPTPIAPLPAVPQPNDAREVRISGVVQIGGTPYAIVSVPDEVERYVRAGERIAGGRVLVKRIDTRSVEPRVVLEQNGIEVERSVSGTAEVAAESNPEELPTPPGSPQASLAALPALSPLPAPGIYQ